MKQARFIIVFLVILSVTLSSTIAFAFRGNFYKSMLGRSSMEALIAQKEIANMIAKEGEACYKKIYGPNSPWLKKQIAIFVIDVKNTNFDVYPPAEIVGHGALDMHNVNTKPFMNNILVTSGVTDEHSWFHFIFQNEFSEVVHAPNGRKYIVIATKNILELEKKLIVKLVNDACTLISLAGDDAFPILNKKDSIFRYNDTYTYVYDKDGVCVVNPNYPVSVGKNMLNYTTDTGFTPIKKVVDAALKDGEAWVVTASLEPSRETDKGETRWAMDKKGVYLKKKLNYVKKLSYMGKVYIVGSGVYLMK